MRVITGSARGRKLKALEGYDVRPTTDKVKEAIFSAIQFDIENAEVLDLFAGSGQLGIEALSRGAKIAFFTDKSKSAIEIIKDNLNYTNLISQARVANINGIDFIKATAQMFDIAFLDPPYNKGTLLEVLPLLEPHIKADGKVICEHESNLSMPENIGRLILKKQYRYSKITVTIYTMPTENEEEE